MAWNPFEPYDATPNQELIAKRDATLRQFQNPAPTNAQNVKTGIYAAAAGGAAYFSKRIFETVKAGSVAAGAVKVASSLPGALAIGAGYFALTHALDRNGNRIQAKNTLALENATLRKRTGVDFGTGAVTMEEVARIQEITRAGRAAASGEAAKRITGEGMGHGMPATDAAGRNPS